MSGITIEKDLFVEANIVDPNSPEGKKIHNFLLARAQKLVGNIIDFDKTPLAFVMSDSEEPNAFFTRSGKDTKAPERHDHDRHENIVYVKNPLDLPLIGVTKGLIDMVDNLDQLDYVLGHELTHMIFRGYGIEANSKGEEELADLHSVDLVYDAGLDPKQALSFEKKLNEYAKQQREKTKNDNPDNDLDDESNEEEKGIDWSNIVDVHMTHNNRTSALEASLTRLSHLIDERMPSDIDKSTFVASYTDPVDEYLKKNDFDNQTPVDQLKTLVGSVEHLSKRTPVKEFFQDQLGKLSEDDWYAQELQERIKTGNFEGYFSGDVIEKKYQQKIAKLSENIQWEIQKNIHEEESEEQEKTGKWPHEKPTKTEIEVGDFYISLQNKSYDHIKKQSYPNPDDKNYLLSSGVLYTYFYSLVSRIVSREKQSNVVLPQIDLDIDQAKENIRQANSFKELKKTNESFKALSKTLTDLRSSGHNHEKFQNLSFLSPQDEYRYRHLTKIYPDWISTKSIQWNNLFDIAKTGKKPKKYVVKFLKQHGVEDLRITHDQPYVTSKINYETDQADYIYKVTEEGNLKKVNNYDLSYALNHKTVSKTYDYIETYFNNEPSLFNNACNSISTLKKEDFGTFDAKRGDSSDTRRAFQKIAGFISLFKTLPSVNKGDDHFQQNPAIFSYISSEYFRAQKPLGLKEGKFSFDTHLLDYTNSIFRERFAEDTEKWFSAKESQRQKIFDTGMASLEIITNIWPDIFEGKKIKDLGKESNKLWGEIRKLKDGEERENKIKEKENLDLERSFYEENIKYINIFVEGFVSEIFENNSKLTSEQEQIIANYVVKDESGVFTKILQGHGYRSHNYISFCNFIDVLPKQIENVISGDYELTDTMKIVAKNLGYKAVNTKEDIKEFVEKHYKGEQGNTSRYTRHLNVFDTMRYLEKTPEIDISDLSKIISSIEVGDSNHSKKPMYNNYKNLLTKSNFIELIAKAIDFQGNYPNSSIDEDTDIVDSLLSIRTQLTPLLKEKKERKTSKVQRAYKKLLSIFNKNAILFSREPEDEIIIKPENKKFLSALDENIEDILRKTEEKILQQENPFNKITDLYSFYNLGKGDSHSTITISSELSKLNEKEKRLERISNLSKSPDFWPEDPFEHIQAFILAKDLFLDEIELKNEVLNNILDKVEQLPAGKKKNECLYILLDKNLRASFPETRQKLFDIYTKDILKKLGKDDDSEKYKNRLSLYLKALDNPEGRAFYSRDDDTPVWKRSLSTKMASADKYALLRQISDAVISQEEVSGVIKKTCHINLNSENLMSSYLYGVGVDYITSEMDRDADTANKLLQFINSKGEASDCAEMSSYFKVAIRKQYEDTGDKHEFDRALEQVKPINCKILYENFWSAPLEARAVIVARILKSAVNVKAANDNGGQKSWENVFDVVMDNIISPDDTSTESKYARDIMHSYIKSRSDYERELILSAMMVANRNIGKDAGNVGKALKLFLENMGPAEIKLGQAISSHPDTPESIRVELQDLKNSADMPARWTLYDWIKAENIPEEFWKDQYLGEILGSASYYTTVALGDDKVLRILRPEAREKATKGFRVIGDTVDDLKEKEKSSNLDYKELTSSVTEMVTQAGRMSVIETDHDIGQTQYEDAQEIYNGVTISSGSETFSLKVMDWKTKGKNWIIMDRAKGLMFNDLPEDTPKQVTYKKDFAKAYIVFEMMNILSGGKFDHDRHGAQLCIDSDTNEVGIFDTGAMALEKPTPEQQQMLGHVIYDVVKSSVGSKNPLMALGGALNNKIEYLHKKDIDTQYFVEVKKGMLALGDFFNVLDQDDIKNIMPDIGLISELSEHVGLGVTEKMTLLEKAKIKALIATKKLSPAYNNVSIHRKPSKIMNNVENINISPKEQRKSSWLQDAFDTDADNDAPTTTDAQYAPIDQKVRAYA